MGNGNRQSIATGILLGQRGAVATGILLGGRPAANRSSGEGDQAGTDKGRKESRWGRIVAVKPDHMVVYREGEGILYVKGEHIKSLHMDSLEDAEVGRPDTGPYLEADRFEDVLKLLKYRWVRINSGGPESVEGVLVDTNHERTIMVVKDEMVTVYNFHIKSVANGADGSNSGG